MRGSGNGIGRQFACGGKGKPVKLFLETYLLVYYVKSGHKNQNDLKRCITVLSTFVTLVTILMVYKNRIIL